MNKHIVALSGLMLALAVLGGCAQAPTQAPTPAAEAPAATTPPAATEAPTAPGAAGAQTGEGFRGSPLEDPSSPLSKRVFYFPFDSAEVSAADRDVIAAHAKFLADNSKVSVVVEGHADERGSREYNLALGERRAQAIERLLTLQGAAKSQLKVISFGEERPVATGHDEAAWRLNRRVELLYSGY